MVVSRGKLHEMMSERLSLALRGHMQKIKARADEALFKAHEVRDGSGCGSARNS